LLKVKLEIMTLEEGEKSRKKEGHPVWDKRRFRGEIITFSLSGVFTEK